MKLNNICIGLLKSLGYKIDFQYQNKNIIHHLSLLGCTIAMFLLSILTIDKIGLFLFGFHFLSLSYKWLLNLFQMINLKRKLNHTKTKVANNLSSPYSKQFTIFTTILIVLIVIMGMSIFQVPAITYEVLYSIATYFSIIATLLQEILDGLVIIYHANC